MSRDVVTLFFRGDSLVDDNPQKFLKNSPKNDKKIRNKDCSLNGDVSRDDIGDSEQDLFEETKRSYLLVRYTEVIKRSENLKLRGLNSLDSIVEVLEISETKSNKKLCTQCGTIWRASKQKCVTIKLVDGMTIYPFSRESTSNILEPTTLVLCD